MKLIAIQTQGQAQGEFVFGAIDDAASYDRAPVTDLVYIGPGDEGIEIKHRKGWIGRALGKGIHDDTAKRVHAKAPDGGGFVLALADDDVAVAIARRARTIMDGELKTYLVEGDTLTELTGQDATYALDDTESALLEEPSVTGGDDDLPRGRLSRP
jgi:hypothetical protein